jgi:hypothetical protein
VAAAPLLIITSKCLSVSLSRLSLSVSLSPSL